MIWKCNNQFHCNIHEPRPAFAASAQRATPLISCAYIQQLLFIACTEPRPLIHCRCRTPRVLSLQYTIEYYSKNNMQQTYSLHKVTSIFKSHIPVFASLREAALTYPSRYQFFHAGHPGRCCLTL